MIGGLGNGGRLVDESGASGDRNSGSLKNSEFFRMIGFLRFSDFLDFKISHIS